MSDFKCFVKEHGLFQIELKIRYPVKDSMNKYTLQTYIFSPKVLAIDKKNYGVSSFLKDLKVMTRISTPDILLARLVNEDCSESPVTRLKKELTSNITKKKLNKKKIIYELRTLASIIRVQMRKNKIFLMKKTDNKEDRDLVNSWFSGFLDELEQFLLCHRELKKLFINPEIEDELNLAYEWADESISLNIQRELGIMFKYCSMHKGLKSFCPRINDIVLNEMKHRAHYRYPSSEVDIEKRSSGEGLVYRQSILKKWSQSVMYLNRSTSFQPERITQIIAGTAAAVAMSFAVITSILTNKFFPENSTVWALALVLAYILKDRIKETLRAGLKSFIPKAVPDRMSILKDAAVQRRIGHYKSFVSFHSADRIDKEIQEARGIGSKPFEDILPSENVILYEHLIRLDGAKIYRNHKRIDSITEIIRLELHKFIQLMDDPDRIYYYSENNTINKTRLRRVYHLNLVTVLLDRKTGEKTTYHHRLILNREGLIRVERVS